MVKLSRKPASYEDQTSFATGSLLYESISRPEPEVENSRDKKKNRLKSVLLGVAVLFIVVGLVVAYALIRQNDKQLRMPDKQASDQAQHAKLSPFQKRLNELETDLKQADPSQENLPFPPVDLEINLSEE